ncbi:hypothetical protein NHX12_010084 [Muraenolepis orangiensis]|uniref:Uncharacterized protein n=1 Tax=Muraenolepis orangiensis TaxID=630683 RepID=A0A9Q0DIW1_9TELE|nr:hypothetical protein NHX12_010084 [Muraenolepis orangiensis]
MSQEDVRSTHSGSSDGPDPDPDPRSQSPRRDSVVLEHMATLSIDMFEPRDFKGRFTKVQSKFRIRTTIIGGRSAVSLGTRS